MYFSGNGLWLQMEPSEFWLGLLVIHADPAPCLSSPAPEPEAWEQGLIIIQSPTAAPAAEST
jgi:hypothetical protein